MKLLFFVILVFISQLRANISFAITPAEIAENAMLQFSKLSVPSKSANAFEKWAYDISGMTVIHCWQSLQKGCAHPDKLANFKPTGAGTWRLPEENKTLKLIFPPPKRPKR